MNRYRFIIMTLAVLLLASFIQRPSVAKRSMITATPQFTVADTAQNRLLCAIDAKGSCHANVLRDFLPPVEAAAASAASCLEGVSAGIYPCRNIHLQSFLPLSDMGGGSGSDLWGWTDPESGREYVLMGRSNGTAFIDITDPQAPLYLGNLPSHTIAAIWRDVKVYANHAFIVADDMGTHGMQVFDLTQLRSVDSPPQTFSETAHYDQIGSAHNLHINEESGYAYIVRVVSGARRCGGGLHIVDVKNPASPTFSGCFFNGRLTHDTQCVIYNGPDVRYGGGEICFSANETAFNIVDVTDKTAPLDLGDSFYPGLTYAHQGWLSEDQRYYFLNDELDESTSSPVPHTYVWDVSDLQNPQLIYTYRGVEAAIDHNLYIHDGFVFQANYRSGLRVLTLGSGSVPSLQEVGYFDTFPSASDDELRFNGAWSSFPFFESGSVAVSTIEHGLFILTLDDALRGPVEPAPDTYHLYLSVLKSEE